MDDDAMRRFPVPDRDDLSDNLRERIDDETEYAGFTPNVFAAFTCKPSYFRFLFKYHDAFVEDTDLERHEVEMIAMAISGVNHYYHCSVTHGALVRIYAKDPLLVGQLVANYRTADIPERHKTMLDMTVKLIGSPVKVGGDDLQRLRGTGFSEEVIRDIGAVAAFFNLSSRMAMFADIWPNEEFHILGREPRDD